MDREPILVLVQLTDRTITQRIRLWCGERGFSVLREEDGSSGATPDLVIRGATYRDDLCDLRRLRISHPETFVIILPEAPPARSLELLDMQLPARLLRRREPDTRRPSAASPQHPRLEPDIAELFRAHGLIGASPSVIPMLRHAAKAAQVGDATLLIEGETGTGKQVLASAIHALDPKRRNGPLITVHCGTIPDSLTESELFGHRRGAFSGAVTDRQGLFAAAHKGTILLDDVNDLPAVTQPKLLDVLQRNRIRPVGSDSESAIDVRVIAASNRPLKPLVDEGKFRADLYYRLDVIHLRVPPLRDRFQDLEALILELAQRHRHLYQPIEGVAPELLEALRGYAFPGNIRELEHMVERMLFAKSSGRTLTKEDLNADPEPFFVPGCDLSGIAAKLLQHLEQAHSGTRAVFNMLEREMLQAALRSSTRTRRDVARLFCMSERRLYQRLRALRERHTT